MIADLPCVIVALAFALMGLGSLLAPVRVTAQFGIPALDVDGRNEVRAVYGGFGLAMALALVLALQMPALRGGICLTIGAALFGMAAGRLVSALIDRGIGRWPLRYLGIEIAAGLVVLFAR